ncbi:hypothetical protein ZWY2020_049180 [Hordeum vulgare]|nr:hypothetical protein ZWY2020_049180 [Hordeum vulgare]
MAEAVRDDHRGVVDIVEDDDTGLHPSNHGDSTWEIEELEPEDRTAGPPPRLSPRAAATSDADDVYVAVGKGGSSMAALSWALRQLARPRSFVYLVHVFPVVATIPPHVIKQPSSPTLLPPESNLFSCLFTLAL